MIRLLRTLFLIVLALGLMTVALANRDAVVVRAVPEGIAAYIGTDFALSLPLFLIIFASIALGLLIGFVWEWFREHKHRVTATKSTRELAKLERELAAMRDAKGAHQDDVLALLETPKAS
jgi:lipopolysaccharide assembly protein A